VIYGETWKDRDVLPAMEEGLRCTGLGAVVGEATRISLTASRRLQLCAGESGVRAMLLRRWRTVNEKQFAREPNAATTRWCVAPSSSVDGSFDHIDRQRWPVELLRVRGGEPHSWIVGACNAWGYLGLPAALTYGPAATEGPRRATAG
jgi:protein ImuA